MANCGESLGDTEVLDDGFLSAKKVPLLNGEIPERDCAVEREDCSKACNGDTSLDVSECHVSTATELQADVSELPAADQTSPRPKEACKFTITYVGYQSEHQMEAIMALITKDLSEPYSIYTYRYFIHNWPQLCFLAMAGDKCVGAVVCKLDMHKNVIQRGYIAMLAVEKEYRGCKIGTNLVVKAIRAMRDGNCDEVVLETEVTNSAALGLYENLGFVRDKRLFRYYLNGVDALRLKLWLK